MQTRSTSWRAPFHWKLGVSFRKRLAWLRRLLGFAAPGEFRKCRYYGADFRVQDAGIGAEILLHRFEWGQIHRFRAACSRLQPHSFIDVGANIGTYTCTLGRKFPLIGLIAFEPDARNADHLATHLAMNGLAHRVELHRVAIGSENAVAQFHQEAGVHGALSRIVMEGGTTSVQVRRLDDMVKIHDQPLAIKIDVEGHELNAIRGGMNLLRNNWGYAQIESLDHVDEVLTLMHSVGWSLSERFVDELIFEKPRTKS